VLLRDWLPDTTAVFLTPQAVVLNVVNHLDEGDAYKAVSKLKKTRVEAKKGLNGFEHNKLND